MAILDECMQKPSIIFAFLMFFVICNFMYSVLKGTINKLHDCFATFYLKIAVDLSSLPPDSKCYNSVSSVLLVMFQDRASEVGTSMYMVDSENWRSWSLVDIKSVITHVNFNVISNKYLQVIYWSFLKVSKQ